MIYHRALNFGISQKQATGGGGSAPTNNTPPSISGVAVVGQTLTVTAGGWSGSPTPTLSYQWYRGATPISGATSTTYTPIQADAGQNIKCVVTATNSAGSASADSNVVAMLATLLDLYPNAAAAYSVRLLRGAYYGSPCIRVRRSSDNAEQDIGFTILGLLDIASLLSFIGSGSGFIRTVYDQSGNGVNWEQATPANQPMIVNAGVLLTENGFPVFLTDNTNDVLRSSALFGGTSFISSVFKCNDTQGVLYTGTTEGNDFLFAFRVNAGVPLSGATNSSSYRNGVTQTISNQTGVLNAINTGNLIVFSSLLTSVNTTRYANLQIGSGALTATSMYWAELVLYASEPDDYNEIYDNQITHYGVS